MGSKKCYKNWCETFQCNSNSKKNTINAWRHTQKYQKSKTANGNQCNHVLDVFLGDSMLFQNQYCHTCQESQNKSCYCRMILMGMQSGLKIEKKYAILISKHSLRQKIFFKTTYNASKKNNPHDEDLNIREARLVFKMLQILKDNNLRPVNPS